MTSMLILVTSFALVSGCASYELPALADQHPANAAVVVPAAPPRSRTLAYTRADMLALVPVAAAQEGHESHHKSKPSGPKTVVGEGKVIATVPSAKQLVVEHGEIKGFMDAMTMGYRVEPASMLDNLKPGDQVRFTIDVAKKAIIKVEKKQ